MTRVADGEAKSRSLEMIPDGCGAGARGPHGILAERIEYHVADTGWKPALQPA